MASEWNTPRRSEQCAACGRTFEIGEVFSATLYESESGYVRRDFCHNCPVPGEPPPVGSWKTRRPEPAARKVQPFDREAIYAFFERLPEDGTPQQVQFRFVLALLLWRKRALRHERTLEEAGQEVWEFTTPRTGVTHRVVRPPLDEDQLDALSGQIEALLAQQPGDLLTADGRPEDAHA